MALQFGFIVINAAFSKQTHLGTVIFHSVNIISRIFSRPTISVHDKGGNSDFLNRLYKGNESQNMIVFPEGTVTDGISGLLRFHSSVFRYKQPIYLVAIKYHRAFPFLQGKAMSRMMGIELLVDLFQPWINVELIPLGEFQRDQDSAPQQQADTAQHIIANALGLKPSSWDKKDRHKHLYPCK